MTWRVLGFSKQAFLPVARASPVSGRDWANAHLINTANDIHHDDPSLGYRFVADELPAHGITASENRLQRLCSQQRIWSLRAKKRGLSRKPGPPVHDDVVERRFGAEQPNQVWLTDITEHPTDEGKLYLCAIRDMCSGRVVGYSMDSWMKDALAVSALHNAIALRSPVGTIMHSDRGSQGGFSWSSQHLDRGGVMDRPAGCMTALTGRSPMKSPGTPSHRRAVEREFWREIAKGLLPEEAAGAVGVSQAVGARVVSPRRRHAIC